MTLHSLQFAALCRASRIALHCSACCRAESPFSYTAGCQVGLKATLASVCSCRFADQHALTIRGDDIAQPLDHIRNSQRVLLVVVHYQARNDNAQHDIDHTLQPCRHDHESICWIGPTCSTLVGAEKALAATVQCVAPCSNWLAAWRPPTERDKHGALQLAAGVPPQRVWQASTFEGLPCRLVTVRAPAKVSDSHRVARLNAMRTTGHRRAVCLTLDVVKKPVSTQDASALLCVNHKAGVARAWTLPTAAPRAGVRAAVTLLRVRRVPCTFVLHIRVKGSRCCIA